MVDRWHIALALKREAVELFNSMFARENKKTQKALQDIRKAWNGYARDGAELRLDYYTTWDEDSLMVKFLNKFFYQAKKDSYLFIRVAENCSSDFYEIRGEWKKNPFELKIQRGYSLSYHAV